MLSPESELPQAWPDHDEEFRFRRIAVPDSVLYLICSGRTGRVTGWKELRKAMTKTNKREEMPLKPVGFALAAVVAGLGAGKAQAIEAPQRAPLEPASHANTYFVDPTNHPGFEEDPDMIVGPSTPVVPLAGRKE